LGKEWLKEWAGVGGGRVRGGRVRVGCGRGGARGGFITSFNIYIFPM